MQTNKNYLATIMTVETKFLNNSVNYSEEYMIKKSLCKYIETYNKYLYNYKTKTNLHDNKDCEVKIPNNNKKFFLYIVKKVENNKNCYTLYFFPDKNSKVYYSNFLLIKNTIDDFCIECDITFDDNSYLLEGYLYGDSNKKQFLITDILFRNNELIDNNFNGRMSLVHNLFFSKLHKMDNLNNLISIGIHHYVTNPLLKIFLNNFVWKSELICIETVCNFEKTIKYLPDKEICKNNKESDVSVSSTKKIIKSKVSDIYNVYNIDTSDSEGILYISTLKMSKYLNNIFKENNELNLQCTFNKHFQKWAVIN